LLIYGEGRSMSGAKPFDINARRWRIVYIVPFRGFTRAKRAILLTVGERTRLHLDG